MKFKNLAVVCTLLLATLPAYADLQVTVTGGDIAPLPIAIVPFPQVPEVSLDVAKVIDADLNSSGRFKVLPRSDMVERPSTPAQVNGSTWKSMGMDNLVIGQVGRTENNGFYARFFLIDTISGQQILGYDMPARSADGMRQVAHRISNMIYEKLLGVPGYFDTKIAYIIAAGYGAQRSFQLAYSDYDGENQQPIANSREPLTSPAWSPDGRKLAFVGYEKGRQSIYVWNTDTRQINKVVSERGITGSPAWSPDGSKLAVTLSFESNPDVYVVDLASGARRRITDHYGIDTEPAFSPDGSKIAFTSDRGGQPQIYEVDVNGGDPRRVSFDGKQNMRPSYTPDGKSLVIVNYDGGAYRIAMLNLANGALKLLSDGPLDESPSLAPGGAVIIYSAQATHELAMVSSDGRIRQRFRHAGEVSTPAWSPAMK